MRLLTQSYSPLLRNPRPWKPELGSHFHTTWLLVPSSFTIYPLLQFFIFHLGLKSKQEKARKTGNEQVCTWEPQSLSKDKTHTHTREKLCNCERAICSKPLLSPLTVLACLSRPVHHMRYEGLSPHSPVSPTDLPIRPFITSHCFNNYSLIVNLKIR